MTFARDPGTKWKMKVEDEEDKTSVPTICMRTDINSGIACLSLGRFFFFYLLPPLARWEVDGVGVKLTFEERIKES